MRCFWPSLIFEKWQTPWGWEGSQSVEKGGCQVHGHTGPAIQKGTQPTFAEVPTPRPDGLRPQGSP